MVDLRSADIPQWRRGCLKSIRSNSILAADDRLRIVSSAVVLSAPRGLYVSLNHHCCAQAQTAS